MSKEIFLARAILHIIFSWIAKPVIFISDLTIYLISVGFLFSLMLTIFTKQLPETSTFISHNN